MNPFPYLQGYPSEIITRIAELQHAGQLGQWLQARHPQPHQIQTDKALYQYCQQLKEQYLRSAPPVHKAVFDGQLTQVRQALGTHTAVSRVQGSKLKHKTEIRVASLFKQAPANLLRMIVVHELAHIREKEHNKAFYQLCQYMEPNYIQWEFDTRVYLTHLSQSKQ